MKKYSISLFVILATIITHICIIRPHWSEAQKWVAFMLAYWLVPAILNLRLLTAEIKGHQVATTDVIKACFVSFMPVFCVIFGVFYRVVVIYDRFSK